MIIVEGCDNSGKSTLVKALAEDAKLLLVANKHKPRSKDQAFDFLNLAIPLSRKFPTIFDRWTPISESVYGPIIRGKSIFTEKDLSIAMAAPLLARCKPVIIYCRPSDESISGTIKVREQMDGVPENLPQIIAAYDRVIDNWAHNHQHSYPTMRYDYRDPAAYGRIKSRVLNHLKEQFE